MTMRTARLGKLSCADPAPGAATSANHAAMIAPMRHVFIVCPCPDRFCGACEGVSDFAGRMPIISEVGKSSGAWRRRAGNDGMVQSPDPIFKQPGTIQL